MALEAEKRYSKRMFCSFVLFIIYLSNILLGKAALVWNIDKLLPVLMGDIAEFLILLSSIFFFTIEVLKREYLREQSH